MNFQLYELRALRDIIKRQSLRALLRKIKNRYVSGFQARRKIGLQPLLFEVIFLLIIR